MKKLLFVFVLIALLNIGVPGQESVETIGKKIVKVFENSGERGMILWMKKNKDRVSPDLIEKFAQVGVDLRLEKAVTISLVLAQHKGDQHVLAKTYHMAGDFFLFTWDFKQAMAYYNKALPLYERLNDFNGKGLVYFNLVNIYYPQQRYTHALDEARKAAQFFKKAGNIERQGNSYMIQGNIYSYIGDNIHALEMYKKAMGLYKQTGNLPGQGKVCLEKGWVYFSIGNMNRALTMLDRALNYFREGGDLTGQCSVYLKKGEMYFRNRKLDKAIEIYKESLPLFEKADDQVKLGNLYHQKGMAYYESGDTASALEMFKKACSFYEKTGDLLMKSEVELFTAMIYFDRNENSRALEILEEKLHFYEKLENAAGIANVCWLMGDIFLIIGENERAMEMEKRALLSYEKAGFPLKKGKVYTSLGNNYFYSGEYANAMEMYQHALPLLEQKQEVRKIGEVYYRMGDIHLFKGNIISALDMYERALISYKKVSAIAAQCEVYRGKAFVYYMTGNPRRAMEMYDQALRLYKDVENLAGQGMIYIGKALIYCENGEYSSALDMYSKALFYLDQADSPWGKGWVFLGQSRIYLLKEDYANAKKMCEKALEIFKRLEFPQAYSHALTSLGDIYLLTDHTEEGKQMYDKALEIHTGLGDISAIVLIYLKKVLVMFKLGKIDEAIIFFEKGFSYLEKYREQAAFSPMKLTLMEEWYTWYVQVIDLMMAFNHNEPAFKYLEYMTARVFMDQLAEGLVKTEKGITPALLQERDHLVAKLSLHSKKISQAARKKDEEKLMILKNEYDKMEREFEDLLLKIRLHNPLYASITYPEPITLQNLQKNVLKKGEFLLRYFTGPNTHLVYAFLVSQDKFKVIRLEVKSGDIRKYVTWYLRSVHFKSTPKIIENGRRLYDMLFKSIEQELKSVSDIIILPDGELAKVPFESFVIDDTNSDRPVYLLEKYRIKYIQSASVLATLRKHYRRERKTNHFIGFGDPVYDYENFIQGKPERGIPDPDKGNEIKEIHRGKYDREGGMYNRLPGSGQEIITIAKLFKKQDQRSLVYLRDKANEDNAKAPDMKKYDYIHFSCHGTLGDSFQSLVLSQLPQAKEDGYLTLNEIMNCDYNAKLVVLSACQTGSGKMERAEGVTGLTRAVMYAGTPAVVASLWNVSDIGTKELMVKFYSNLLEKGMSKEEALRQAKLELIKSEKYSSPYFWGAFVMYGG
jgi:CHAT domain-containing protein/tetratricopeptide (TPR) repeat protein